IRSRGAPPGARTEHAMTEPPMTETIEGAVCDLHPDRIAVRTRPASTIPGDPDGRPVTLRFCEECAEAEDAYEALVADALRGGDADADDLRRRQEDGLLEAGIVSSRRAARTWAAYLRGEL